ncbi:hypothetical protein F511_30840 [Dorcoceras hygrometricum]|uniref:Uncharacterized protein n=1 Tax=Dorcoceras hygrometricum TaxID=472368 RepID=A0A2Z7BHS5_9LAMI|nr:hypothetical protein F511_30840 [Dorcoceras hygrometricum]
MRVSKNNRKSRPTTQLANQRSLSTTHIQSAGGSHRSVIFWNDTHSTIKAQWYSGTKTQSATTSMIALDLSGATTQPADHNASSTRASIKFRLNILKPRSLKQLPQLNGALSSSSKLRSVRNHLPKAVQGRKNHWTTIAKIFELCNYFALPQLIDSSLQTDLGTTSNLSANSDLTLLCYPRAPSPNNVALKSRSKQPISRQRLARSSRFGQI